VFSLPRIHHLAFAVALLAAGCDSSPVEPPSEFPFASATPECDPTDGPAITIFLTRDTLPALPPGGGRVRVYLWHSLQELRGRSWTVGGLSQDGVAEYVDGTGTITTLRGTITVTEVLADSTVEGEVDLASDSAFGVQGGFRATWIPRTLMCG